MALTFADIAKSVLSTAVVTCGDYACSDGYEYKDDYGSITCTDDCDDDQCCDLGGFVLSGRCTITTYVLYLHHTYHSSFNCNLLSLGKDGHRLDHPTIHIFYCQWIVGPVVQIVRFDVIRLLATV